jgi:hypothetical protein
MFQEHDLLVTVVSKITEMKWDAKATETGMVMETITRAMTQTSILTDYS